MAEEMKEHDIAVKVIPLHSGAQIRLFVNRNTGLVCLDLEGERGGNEIFRKVLDEKSLLAHLKGHKDLPSRDGLKTIILTSTGQIGQYHLNMGLKCPAETEDEPVKEDTKESQGEETEEGNEYFLESICSEISEDDYERGVLDYTGCGLPHTPISKRFESKELMLKFVESSYGYSGFEEPEEPGVMLTSKMVADHSNEQNGGWFDPTPEETELWKKGKMKLYCEDVTIQYHTIG